MKKMIYIIIIAAFSSAISMNAQSTTSFNDRVYVGAKAGINYSNVYDTEGEEFDADSKFGAVIGGFLVVPLTEFIKFQPELLFSQKGFQGKGKILGSPYEFSRTTSYIDIPLLVSLSPNDFMTILAGPQYSYLLNEKNTFTNSITDVETEDEFENDNIRKNTMCFLAGIDVNVDNLVFGTRIGFDLFKNNGDGTDTTPRYKNVWGQLTVGYRF